MRIAGLVCALVLAAATAHALDVGEAAPDFKLTDQNGKPFHLKDFRDKSNVVVAFYVRAFTPG